MTGARWLTHIWKGSAWRLLGGLAVLIQASAGPCAGHPTYITMAHAVVGEDGSCHVTVQFDVLAFALNDTSARIGNEPMEALLKAPRAEIERVFRDASGRFERGFSIVTDHGLAAPLTIHFPTVDDLTHWRETAPPPILPVVIPVEIDARLPVSTGTVALRFPDLLAEIILTVERPGEDFFTEPIDGGKVSTKLEVHCKASKLP